MTNTADDAEEEPIAEELATVSEAQDPPVWLRASVADLVGLDFEAPVAASRSADCDELGRLFRTAIDNAVLDGKAETPAARVFSMLTSVMGMHLKAKEPNEPFRPMVVWADGSRSAAPVDFRGEPLDVFAQMAMHAKHPVLRARLADVCWLLDRKRVQLGASAISAYVGIVKQVDAGTLKFRFDNEQGALKHEACELLRRALSIARGKGLDPSAGAAARELVADLRKTSFEKRLPVPSLWFAHLDLDFGVSDPGEIGTGVESLVDSLAADTDGHTIVNLWRLASRAFHLGKRDSDQHHSQSETAEQLARMAGQQPLAMLAAGMLAEAPVGRSKSPGYGHLKLPHSIIAVSAAEQR